jgi:transcriptional regulator with XRE-family HTH domain
VEHSLDTTWWRNRLMGRHARRKTKFLGIKLRAIRAALGGLTQNELIEYLELTDYVNQGDISAFERGDRDPDLITLKAYADALGISTDVLISDEATLPQELPAKRATGLSGKSQNQRPKAIMNSTAVTLWLLIQSDEGSRFAENRARKAIEKAYLERYAMKKLQGHQYDLTFPHVDETELDDRIYTLLGSIYIEARRRNCSIKVTAREKDGDRCW